MQILSTAHATLDQVGLGLAPGWMSTETVWATVWTGGLAATPVAILVLLLSSTRRMRPVTRHALAVVALLSFVTPAAVTAFWRPDWLGHAFAHLDAARTMQPELMQPDVPPSAAMAASDPAYLPAASPAESPAKGPAETLLAHVGDRRATAPPLTSAGPPARPTPSARDDAVGRGTRARAERAVPTDDARAADVWPVGDIRASGADAPTAVDVPAPARPPGSHEPFDAATSGPAPSAFVTALSAMRASLDSLTRARDAIVHGPPLPALVWLVGAAALALSQAIRLALGARLVRRSTDAPADVVRSACDAAEALGLRRVPCVRMTAARVSPMVWCGFRPTLLLPTQLWESLDDDSRAAVLLHELAHVRRGDHRWCWLEWAVLTIYWWHPLVWWLRRSLRDESETCCDAWVVALLPRARRAYAEALVTATAFLNRHDRVPSLGLGVLPVHPSPSPRQARRLAQRLARRITMVMTDRTAPRLSSLGALVALVALGLGAVVTPGLACPPEKDEAVAVAKVRQKERKQQRNPIAVRVPAPQGAADAPGEVLFFGEAPAIEALAAGEYAAAQARLAEERARLRAAEAMGQFRGPQREEVRAYALPSGKLEALIELMARQDVPIFITPHDDRIEVRGTPDQHRVFEAFIRLIHPQGGAGDPLGATWRRQPAAQAQQLEEVLRAYKLGQDEEARARARMTVEQAQQHLHSLLEMRERVEAEAEMSRDHAERVRERADQVRMMVDSISDQADETDDPAVLSTLHSALQALHSRYGALEREANEKVAAVERMESKLADLEAQLSEAEVRIEALMERLDAEEEAEDEAEEVGETGHVDAAVPFGCTDGPVIARVPAPPAPSPALPAPPALAPAAPSVPMATTVPAAPAAIPAPAAAPTAPSAR